MLLKLSSYPFFVRMYHNIKISLLAKWILKHIKSFPNRKNFGCTYSFEIQSYVSKALLSHWILLVLDTSYYLETPFLGKQIGPGRVPG